MKHNLIVAIFICLVVKSYGLKDYYWKDFTGKIPDDAFPGGHNVDNENTYIGQVFIKDLGIFPATIYSGNKVVFVSADGVRKSENFIQILCSENPEYFHWIPANKTHFHFTTMHKHLVRGGIQDGNWLHIGRINYQGEIIVGKILSGRSGLNDAYMNFIHNDEKIALSYEVLTFDKESVKKKDVELVDNVVELS